MRFLLHGAAGEEPFLTAKPYRIIISSMHMQLKLITASFDPDTGGFPADSLLSLEIEVISVGDNFFQHWPAAALARALSTNQGSAPSPGQSCDLSSPAFAPERELFGRLSDWRNERDQAEGVPPYVLLNNRQVAKIAQRRPTTLTALCEIEGIDKAKANRIGRELLAHSAEQ